MSTEVAAAIKELAQSIDRLGMNGAVEPQSGIAMGAIEVLAKEVKELRESIDTWGERICAALEDQ